MLVLKRMPGEWIRITTPEGRVIRVKMVERRGADGHHRIGFEADHSVKIMREELIKGEHRGL